MADDKYTCWRVCEMDLKEDGITPWRAASLRRAKMNQVFYEWMSKDMEYDMFEYLLDDEMKEYGKVMDDKNLHKKREEMVEKIAPNFKANMEKLTSRLTSEKLLEMDCVKTALEHCKVFEEIDRKEDEVLEKIIISTKKNPPPPPEGQKIPPPSSRNPCRTKDVFSVQRQQKRLSIYQTMDNMEATTSADHQTVHEKNFFEETLKKRRKFGVPRETDDSEEMEVEPEKKFHFKSARQQYEIDKKKNRNQSPQGAFSNTSNTTVKKSLGARPRNTCFGKFIPPSIKDQKEPNERENPSRRQATSDSVEDDSDLDPRLKSIEPKIIELVTNEIMDHGPPVQWDDIAGLEFAKNTIKEIVIWPMLRPDIFTGLRGPPKGILLFGPPGTGKTLIGKCIASQSGATFFSISASSLTSKWVGEGEKMVRALFAVASCHQPAVIFIDEIDSLLSQRCDSEHESSRRIKTEFLVQLDGAATSPEERILVVGATNRPQEIDEAARRRLSKRLYIPLPEDDARKQIVESLLQQQRYKLSDDEISIIISETDGYSGADMANLCREAALGPIRSLQGMDISAINKDDVRAIILDDFKKALLRVRPSVSDKDLDLFIKWNKQFGCCAL